MYYLFLEKTNQKFNKNFQFNYLYYITDLENLNYDIIKSEDKKYVGFNPEDFSTSTNAYSSLSQYTCNFKNSEFSEEERIALSDCLFKIINEITPNHTLIKFTLNKNCDYMILK